MSIETVDPLDNKEEIVDDSKKESQELPRVRSFHDSFISFDDHIKLPEITVTQSVTPDSIEANLHQIEITNTSNFPYSVSLSKLPVWCSVTGTETLLNPSETAKFEIGIRTYELSPGILKGSVEILLKRGIVRRQYNLFISGNIIYHTPVPFLELLPISAESKQCLRIVVRNGGSGELKGSIYDRAANVIHGFALYPKEQNVPLVDHLEKNQTADVMKVKECTAYVFEKSFDLSKIQHESIVIMSDPECCRIKKLAQIEIRPADYFPQPIFADAGSLNFQNLSSGDSQELSLNILHPQFLQKCEVVIPPSLMHNLKVESQRPGEVVFSCQVKDVSSKEKVRAGCVIFIGEGSVQHSMPVCIC